MNRHRTTHVAEHLANERTYLAWLRTALGLIALGIAVNRLARYLQQLELSRSTSPPLHRIALDAEWMGTGFVVLGLLVLPLVTRHFLKRARQIETDAFQWLSISVLLLSAAIFSLGLFAFVWFHVR